MHNFVAVISGYKFVGYDTGLILVYKGEGHIDSFNAHSGLLDYSQFNKEVNDYVKFNLNNQLTN